MDKSKTFDSVVAATILGIFVSASLGGLAYYQKGQDMERERIRYEREWNRDELRYSMAEALSDDQFMQDLQLKLQNQYIESRTIEDLVRLNNSLDWVEKETPHESAKPIVSSFRRLIKRSLGAKLKANDSQNIGAAERKLGEQTVSRLEAIATQEKQIQTANIELAIKKVEADAKADIISKTTTKERTGKDRRLMKIYELTCLDTQSRWPKKCDEVYLTVNGGRLWSEPRKICRGTRLMLDEEIYFDDDTIVELWEYDNLKDDSLGQFKVVDHLQKSSGRAVLKDSTDKGSWSYLVKYKVD